MSWNRPATPFPSAPPGGSRRALSNSRMPLPHRPHLKAAGLRGSVSQESPSAPGCAPAAARRDGVRRPRPSPPDSPRLSDSLGLLCTAGGERFDLDGALAGRRAAPSVLRSAVRALRRPSPRGKKLRPRSRPASVSARPPGSVRSADFRGRRGRCRPDPGDSPSRGGRRRRHSRTPPAPPRPGR